MIDQTRYPWPKRREPFGWRDLAGYMIGVPLCGMCVIVLAFVVLIEWLADCAENITRRRP